jgi:sigma-B regulation protein RsbU (phosphoserine phosphatase)
VTLFLGIFDPATRKLLYVNAGHNPQFVLRPNQPIERMAATGIPIGLLAGRGYEQREVRLAAGDLIFFYTDGCVETENEADEMFGPNNEALLVSIATLAPVTLTASSIRWSSRDRVPAAWTVRRRPVMAVRSVGSIAQSAGH